MKNAMACLILITTGAVCRMARLFAKVVFTVTNFNKLLTRCGLSSRGAATLFNVRYDTIRNWKYGKCKAPEPVMQQMEELTQEVERIFNLC